MDLIKCPNCGESDLVETSPGCYTCKVCNATIKDDKISEILELLKSNPDNFLGNIRYRLRTELNKDVLDKEYISELASKILDNEPEDPFTLYVLAFIKRKKYKKEYKECIQSLIDRDLELYQSRQIANCLIRFFEPTYYTLSKEFIKRKGLPLDFINQLDERKEAMPSLLDLIDTHIHRDLFVLCDDDDYERVEPLVNYLENNNFTCWYQPRNLDDEQEYFSEVKSAIENCTAIVIMSSEWLWQNKDMRALVNYINDKYIRDNLLPNVFLYNFDHYPFNSTKFDGGIDVVEDLDQEFPKENLLNFTADFVRKQDRKDRIINAKKVSDVTKTVERGNYQKAISEIEDLLEEDGDEFELRKLLMRIYHEKGEADSNVAQKNFKRLKQISNPETIASLENTYPSYIDEEKSFKEGMQAFMNKDFVNAIQMFQRAAKKKHALSLNKLGEIYFLGRGVEPNVDKGINYYTKAAELGCSDAYRMLGMMYLMGNKVYKDQDKAFKYFLKGADQGNAFCQLRVAHCYQDGIGTISSEAKAFEYYKKASEQNQPEALRFLGYCYKYGKGTNVDQKMAQECFKLAVSYGDIESKRELFGF